MLLAGVAELRGDVRGGEGEADVCGPVDCCSMSR